MLIKSNRITIAVHWLQQFSADAVLVRHVRVSVLNPVQFKTNIIWSKKKVKIERVLSADVFIGLI